MRILSIILLLALVGCSKGDSIKMDLDVLLGNSVYTPTKDSNAHPYMPTAFSLINAQVQNGAIYAPYYSDKCTISKNGNSYTLTSKHHTNPSMDFDMEVWQGGFRLKGGQFEAEYEKQ